MNKTVDKDEHENPTTDQLTPEEEYSRAFDEDDLDANDDGGIPDEAIDPDSEPDTGSSPSDAAATPNPIESKSTGDGSTEDDWRVPKSVDVNALTSQQLLSYQGRIAQKEAQIDDIIEGRVQKALRQQAEQAKQSQQDTDNSPEEEEELGEEDDFFEEDHPELAKRFKKTERQVTKQVETATAQVTALQQQLEVERHNNSILKNHSDYFDLIADGGKQLTEWAENLPFRQASYYLSVLDHGTADQVSELLTTYKNSQSPQQQQSRRADASSLASPRPAPAKAPHGKPDMNDYDAAWDEDD